MDDREYFKRVHLDTVDQTVGRIDQLPELGVADFWDHTPGLRIVAGLFEAGNQAIGELLGIDGRVEADVLGNRSELRDRMFSPAQRPCGQGLGRAANTGPHSGERLIGAQRAAGLGIGHAGINRRTDVDLVGEIVPRRGLRESVNELPSLGLNVARIGHERILGASLPLGKGYSVLSG
jgi:hypothetical protein